MFFKTTHWCISWWINKTLIISRRTVRMWKKYRRRKYNVTLGRVRAAIVVVEKQWVLHSLSVYICRLWYPTRNAHAPYCHLWPTSLYNIFPHFLIKGTIFEKKKLLYTKYVFWISLQLLLETFHILGRNERYMIINVFWYSYKVPVILVWI